MTRKERILRLLDRLGDDLTYDQVIYHLDILRDVEISMGQIERGEVIDHDELFAEILGEDAKNSTGVVGTGKREPSGHSGAHRAGRATNGGKVRKSAPKGGRAAQKAP